jgi:Zn-dependent peptidase ImmA (M78 family)
MPERVLLIENAGRIEKWCNEFSSAFLLPEAIARHLFDSNKPTLTETLTLNRFSRSYKISKAMLLYNMAKLDFISQEQYRAVLDRYVPRQAQAIERAGRGFRRASADKRCMNERGQKFVSLVISNVEKGFITHRDALNYLSIKSKNLEKVTGRAKK